MNTFQKSTADIAAWNLEGFHGIPDVRISRQIEGLTMMDAEAVTLVEINPINVLDKIKQGLLDNGIEYESHLVQQNGKLHMGVLYKKGVIASNPRLIDNSDLGDDRKRKAFVIDMNINKFDFTLIAFHLKSGREIENQKIRDEQAKIIFNYIQNLRSNSRRPIIITGDFNMIPGQDVSNFHHLGGPDVLDFLSNWDLQARFSHILEKGRANLLDGFAITRTYTKEYIRGSLRLFPMHWSMDIGRERFKDDVSDHLPFIATFRID